MIDQCQECQKKPAVNIVLIAEPGRLRARAMCCQCSDYAKPWGEVKTLRSVSTFTLQIPTALLDRVKSDPSNAKCAATGSKGDDHE